MGSLNIGSEDVPKAQSNNVYMVTHRTQEQMDRTIRENYDLLDEMEPGQNYGAFPLGYPCNTTR